MPFAESLLILMVKNQIFHLWCVLFNPSTDQGRSGYPDRSLIYNFLVNSSGAETIILNLVNTIAADAMDPSITSSLTAVVLAI